MKARLPLLLFPAMLLSACNFGPWEAPYTADLIVPEDLQIPWFACQLDPTTGLPQTPGCTNSGSIAFPLSVQVVDPNTLEPYNNVRISVASTYEEVYILPQEVIEAVQLPDTSNWNNIEQDGRVYAEFSGNWEGDYRPTYFEGWTDRNGRMKVWIWVDSMPRNLLTGQAAQTSIIFDIGNEVAQVLMQGGV
jgi:hypothetical protein